MDTGDKGETTFPPLTAVDFTHPTIAPPTKDPRAVAAGLATWSRHLIVAGRTVWIEEPPEEGVAVLQPNRFGFVEDLDAIDELDVPVTVVVRPELAGWVPLPENTHSVRGPDGEPVEAATRGEAEGLADLTDALVARLRQVRGLRLLPGESLGTVSFLLSTATKTVLDALRGRGAAVNDPWPPLPTMSLTIHSTHTLPQLTTVTEIIDASMSGEQPPEMPGPGPGDTPPHRRTLTYHPLP